MLAAERIGRDPEGSAPRQRGARRDAAPLRLLSLPVAALGALVAGLVFLVLLPICGVATIAEGVALCCLDELRGGLTHGNRDNVPQH